MSKMINYAGALSLMLLASPALAADLPDPEMVQRELQALAPDLRLWLVLDAL